MRERKVHKAPGCSWIEINNASHMSIAADVSHRNSFQIYFLLKLLLMELRLASYVPQPDLIYPQQECTARVSSGIYVLQANVVHTQEECIAEDQRCEIGDHSMVNRDGHCTRV